MRWRSWAVNLALAAGTLLLLFAAAEVGLRVVLLRNLNPFVPDPEIGYRLKPDFEGLYPRQWVRTDAHGMRIPLDQGTDAGGELLFIGDSVAFGFGVLAEESFPYVAGRALGEADQVAVAAVPGYNLGQSLALLRESADRVRPRLVVFALVVNDIPGAANPATYGDIDPHAARAARGGVLSRSVFAAFIERRLRRIEARFDPPDEVETAAAMAEVTDFQAQLPAAAVAAFDAQWEELEAMQPQVGVPFYVVVCPYRQQVEGDAGDAFQRFAVGRCGGGPLVCLDPLEELRAAGGKLFNGASSYHYDPRGHRILGEWLARQLDR